MEPTPKLQQLIDTWGKSERSDVQFPMYTVPCEKVLLMKKLRMHEDLMESLGGQLSSKSSSSDRMLCWTSATP